MKYIYKAKKGVDKIVEGTVEAATQDAAVARVIEQGLVPVLVQKESEYLKMESTGPNAAISLKFSFLEKVSKSDIYAFTKKLKVLIRSRIPILNSLYILEDQIANRKFKEVIGDIMKSVREGLNFSESLGKFPKYFSPLYVSIIKAGEASGKLDYSLEQISKYLEDERQISQKVKSSLAYPAVMVTVGVATIIFIITFVVPKLRVLFEDFIDKLPIVTKILLDVSLFFSKYWVLLFMLFVSFIVFLFYTKDTPWQKRILSNIKERTPVLKNIIHNQSLCRFARALSILLSSGVSILDSVRIATPLVDDDSAQKELEKAYRDIVAGGGLEESLGNNCKFLDDIFVKMVAIGEASGRLDRILMELADDYAEEVETSTKIVTSLIEPLAILIVGGILGCIVIAVLLPIFEISFMIQ